MQKRYWCAAWLVVWCASSAAGITIMSYNVLNLFDDVHDGTEYREFDPARGKWTAELFGARITAISNVVRKAVRGGPDLLLLQEVENAYTLESLVSRGLKGMGYAWSVLVPKPGSAVNVAIVSRLPIVRVRSHAVAAWKGEAVRDVIEVEVRSASHTLYVFNNHWKSKTEGVRVTEAARRKAAEVLGRRIAEILSADPEADIIAAGDLNECADEYVRTGMRYQTALMPDGNDGAATAPRSLALSSAHGSWSTAEGTCTLFEPWLEGTHTPAGSYSWQGEWLTMDHMLLSRGLFDLHGFTYHPGSFKPVSLPFLLKGDKAYSDHLPLIMTLDVER
jgi:endonuclease/exonuclease/phosphatase family metal-dependent hydrolase